jgi:predicted enzyme related to lactoylglutathione lyase
MDVLQVSALTFQSADPERLATFYRDALGLPLRLNQHGRMPPHHEGDLGDVHLAVLPAHPSAGGPLTPVFRVRDLDAAIAELGARGLETALKPLTLVPGMRVAGFKDPDGNMFRIPTGATAFPKFERMRCSTAKSAL